MFLFVFSLVWCVPIRSLFNLVCFYLFSLQFGVFLLILSSVRYGSICSLFSLVCSYSFSLQFRMFLFVLSSVRCVPIRSLFSSVCSYFFSLQFGVFHVVLSSVRCVPIRSILSRYVSICSLFNLVRSYLSSLRFGVLIFVLFSSVFEVDSGLWSLWYFLNYMFYADKDYYDRTTRLQGLSETLPGLAVTNYITLLGLRGFTEQYSSVCSTTLHYFSFIWKSQ